MLRVAGGGLPRRQTLRLSSRTSPQTGAATRFLSPSGHCETAIASKRIKMGIEIPGGTVLAIQLCLVTVIAFPVSGESMDENHHLCRKGPRLALSRAKAPCPGVCIFCFDPIPADRQPRCPCALLCSIAHFPRNVYRNFCRGEILTKKTSIHLDSTIIICYNS